MLEDKGVETMFGYPGGSVIPIYDEILNSSIHHVLVRHEQCAAHMADGFFRASGKMGICLATSGPGATNLITGVGTAFADSTPMIVLTGQVASGSLGLGAFQEVDTFSLMMSVTKYNYRVLELNQLPKAITEGWQVAQIGRPGPVHIDLPVDAINSDIDEKLLSKKYRPKAVPTDDSLIPTAIQWIRESKKPVILAGGGVVNSNSSNLIVKLAEKIHAPVLTSLMGIGCIPANHPLSLGALGMHGRVGALNAMKEADLLIAVGTKFSDRTYSSHTSVSEGCRIIHIDIDRVEFNKHNQKALNIKDYASDALKKILAGIGTVPINQSWKSSIADYNRRCNCDFNFDDDPIVPQKVMYEINKILDDDTIITTDVGQNQMWAMHCLKIRRPRQFISSGSFGTMGFGLPSAIGAKAACPDKKVMTITGDGGLLMVIQELATAVAEDLPVVICLMDNGWLGMVKQWQKLFWEKRYSNTALYASNPDFVKLAESFGAKAIRVERPSEMADAFKQAFACDKPCLIDIKVNPEEDALPMLPSNPSIPLVKGRCPF